MYQRTQVSLISAKKRKPLWIGSREMPCSSLLMRRALGSRKSQGRRAHQPVMKSTASTARNAITQS